MEQSLAEIGNWLSGAWSELVRFIEAQPQGPLLRSLVIAAIAVVVALALHQILLVVLRRMAHRTELLSSRELVRRLRSPTRWLLIALALAWVEPALELDARTEHVWERVAGLLVPALIGWLAVALIGVASALVQARTDITQADNLLARRRRTRASILFRIATFAVIVITFCAMLMSIPSVRSIGITIAASAGLAALAVGAAAQPALKNLIAGIQMAFTEPIRIDDVVIIEGEWGRIEEIRLTFVVVKIWDERRLVVPVSKFLEESFQNWTRQTSELLGSVFWYLDPATDIDRFRAKLAELVEANPRWDGRFYNVQVTDTKVDGAIEVRGLMTAKDASTAFDLRCDLREAMLKFVREEMPEAVVRRRGAIEISPQPRIDDPQPAPPAPPEPPSAPR